MPLSKGLSLFDRFFIGAFGGPAALQAAERRYGTRY